MREQNDLTKTLGGNPSQISTRVSVDSHYICLKKKKVWKGIPINFHTSAPGRKNKHHSVLSYV